MMSGFSGAKQVFVDEINVDDYIGLEGSRAAYDRLVNGLDESVKIVLLLGPPGTGKTLMLHRLYENLRHQKELHLIATPLVKREEFHRKLFEIFTGKPQPLNAKVDFDTFVQFAREIKEERKIVVLVDEAQMYPADLLEEMRILSDAGSIKFLLSLHKLDREELLAKEHFQTRVSETITLANASREELATYVHQKLLNKGLVDLADRLSGRQQKFIHRYTGGNFRDCNKLLYTALDLCDFMEKREECRYPEIPMKALEMAAIKTGFVHE